jgi:hypothetical protein
MPTPRLLGYVASSHKDCRCCLHCNAWQQLPLPTQPLPALHPALLPAADRRHSAGCCLLQLLLPRPPYFFFLASSLALSVATLYR